MKIRLILIVLLLGYIRCIANYTQQGNVFNSTHLGIKLSSFYNGTSGIQTIEDRDADGIGVYFTNL